MQLDLPTKSLYSGRVSSALLLHNGSFDLLVHSKVFFPIYSFWADLYMHCLSFLVVRLTKKMGDCFKMLALSSTLFAWSFYIFIYKTVKQITSSWMARNSTLIVSTSSPSSYIGYVLDFIFCWRGSYPMLQPRICGCHYLKLLIILSF